MFYIDEFTILPVLSKCVLTDVGIKEYEEHFVELNKFEDKFIVSVVRKQFPMLSYSVLIFRCEIFGFRNNSTGQKRELVMSTIVVVEDFADSQVLNFVSEPRSAYNSGFSLNIGGQANETKLTVFLLPFGVDSDLVLVECASNLLKRSLKSNGEENQKVVPNSKVS